MGAKGRLSLCFLFFVFFSSFIEPCRAITLLTEKEALREVFPNMEEVVAQRRIISQAQLERIKARLGGKLVNWRGGRRAKEISEQRIFTFYIGKDREGERSIAIILEEPGKWGPIEFMVALDQEARVKEVFVLRYTETRGRPIARRSFLRQFIGKTSRDPLLVRRDIVGVSGATISSGATAFTVKKAIILYEELFLRR